MLYHVPDIAAAARELRRVVRADGLLLAVTNGAGHVAELGRVFEDAIHDVAGDTAFHLGRSGERFTLEDGAAVLGTAFGHVERHDRHAELLVPDPEPVVRYIASMVGLEPSFPDGVTMAAVLERCEPRVRAVIERDGAFRVHVHAGAFVCR
jgi:SAM-dependent methyltransferase